MYHVNCRFCQILFHANAIEETGDQNRELPLLRKMTKSPRNWRRCQVNICLNQYCHRCRGKNSKGMTEKRISRDDKKYICLENIAGDHRK